MRVKLRTTTPPLDPSPRVACDACPSEIGEGEATRVGDTTLCPTCYEAHRNASKVALRPFQVSSSPSGETPESTSPRRALRKLDDGVVYIDDPHASRAHPTASKKTASYELSFSPEFFMGPDDPEMTEPSSKPTTVWQALVSAKNLDPKWWSEMVEEVFPEWEYASSEFPETDVFDKIRETNTCGDLRSPVDVWVDPEGLYTLDVYDSADVESTPKETASCSKCGIPLYAGDQVLDDETSVYCSRLCAGVESGAQGEASPEPTPVQTDSALTTTNPDLAKVVEFRLEAGEDLRVGAICKSGGKEYTITNVTLTGWGISYEFDGGTDVVFVSL